MSTTTSTILLAEEHDATRAFLAENLTADGYRVLTAPDRAKAVALLTTAHPDLILVDINGETLERSTPSLPLGTQSSHDFDVASRALRYRWRTDAAIRVPSSSRTRSKMNLSGSSYDAQGGDAARSGESSFPLPSPRLRTPVTTGDRGLFLPVLKTGYGGATPRWEGSIPSPRRAVAVASEPAIFRETSSLAVASGASPSSR